MPTPDAVSEVTDSDTPRRGGRPRRWTTSVLLRTTTERAARVNRLAADAGLSRNEWVNRAIEYAVQDPAVCKRIEKGLS